MPVAIVTDSTANIPDSIVQTSGIRIVPLNVHVKDKIFREGIDLDKTQYYGLMRQEPIFPKTSRPSSGDFLSAFESIAEGTDILVITISSNLSGTIQSAALATNLLKTGHHPITIIDSLTTVSGQGFLVEQACHMAACGCSVQEIKEELERLKQNNRLYFVVENLEYLARGGRISRISKHIGTILQLKPILHISDGYIELFEKVRTWSRAVNHILMELQTDLDKVKRLAVMHVDALQEAELLRQRIKEFYPVPINIDEVSPVIGTHVGPGAVGIAYHM